MTLNRSGTSYRLEWNSRSASAERMSHLIVICRYVYLFALIVYNIYSIVKRGKDAGFTFKGGLWS